MFDDFAEAPPHIPVPTLPDTNENSHHTSPTLPSTSDYPNFGPSGGPFWNLPSEQFTESQVRFRVLPYLTANFLPTTDQRFGEVYDFLSTDSAVRDYFRERSKTVDPFQLIRVATWNPTVLVHDITSYNPINLTTRVNTFLNPVLNPSAPTSVLSTPVNLFQRFNSKWTNLNENPLPRRNNRPKRKRKPLRRSNQRQSQ